MQPTIEILDRIRKNSRDNKEEIFTRLYRYLLRPDVWRGKDIWKALSGQRKEYPAPYRLSD